MAYFRNVMLNVDDFDSVDEYKRALVEQNYIDKINSNTNIVDPEIAKSLYDGFIEHPEMFRTAVGKEFMAVLKENAEPLLNSDNKNTEPVIDMPEYKEALLTPGSYDKEKSTVSEGEDESIQTDEPEKSEVQVNENPNTVPDTEETDKEESAAAEADAGKTGEGESAAAEADVEETGVEESTDAEAEAGETGEGESAAAEADAAAGETGAEESTGSEAATEETDTEESIVAEAAAEETGTEESAVAEADAEGSTVTEETAAKTSTEESSVAEADIAKAKIQEKIQKKMRAQAGMPKDNQMTVLLDKSSLKSLIIIYPVVFVLFPMAGSIIAALLAVGFLIGIWVQYFKNKMTADNIVKNVLCIIFFPIGLILSVVGIMKKIKYVVNNFKFIKYGFFIYLAPIVYFANIAMIAPDNMVCIIPGVLHKIAGESCWGVTALIADVLIVIGILLYAGWKVASNLLKSIDIRIKKGISEKDAALLVFKMPIIILCMFKELTDGQILYDEV